MKAWSNPHNIKKEISIVNKEETIPKLRSPMNEKASKVADSSSETESDSDEDVKEHETEEKLGVESEDLDIIKDFPKQREPKKKKKKELTAEALERIEKEKVCA